MHQQFSKEKFPLTPEGARNQAQDPGFSNPMYFDSPPPYSAAEGATAPPAGSDGLAGGPYAPAHPTPTFSPGGYAHLPATHGMPGPHSAVMAPPPPHMTINVAPPPIQQGPVIVIGAGGLPPGICAKCRVSIVAKVLSRLLGGIIMEKVCNKVIYQ